jgi:hypothetical protein
MTIVKESCELFSLPLNTKPSLNKNHIQTSFNTNECIHTHDVNTTNAYEYDKVIMMENTHWLRIGLVNENITNFEYVHCLHAYLVNMHVNNQPKVTIDQQWLQLVLSGVFTFDFLLIFMLDI